jgi:DNA excision repair protein ERCC-3
MVYKTFPTGLLPRITSVLDSQHYPYKIVDTRSTPQFSLTQVAERLLDYNITLRRYQHKGVKRGLENKNMMFWWPTASGKTILFGGLITAYNLKTLILVNRTDLVAQHQRFLRDALDIDIGYISEGQWHPKHITVGLVQSLWAKRKKGYKHSAQIKQFLEGIQYLIIDEAHHGNAVTFRTLANSCKNANIRHGFSGTPYILDADDLELECVTGPVMSKVTISYLIQSGYLSKPIITMHNYKSPDVDGENYRTVYRDGIVDNQPRNDLACEIILQRYNQDLLTLVTVQYKKHGFNIKSMLTSKYGIDDRDIVYLSGNDPQDFRNKIKRKFLDGDVRVLIVTSIWNEGVDVPEANALVKLDGGGGMEVSDDRGVRTTIQQVGRILRKSKPNGAQDVDTAAPQYAYVDDFIDNNHRWLRKHSNNRRKTYELEPEFQINEL